MGPRPAPRGLPRGAAGPPRDLGLADRAGIGGPTRTITDIRKALLAAVFLLNAALTVRLAGVFLQRFLRTGEPADPWLLSAAVSVLAVLAFGAYGMDALAGSPWPGAGRHTAGDASAGAHRQATRRNRLMAAWGVFLVAQCGTLARLGTLEPHLLPAHLAASCLALLLAYPPAASLALMAACTAFTVLPLPAHGSPSSLAGCLAVFLLAAAGKALFELLLRDWNEQSAMADQARWAATEFAVANLRLQRSLTDSESLSAQKERSRIAREIHDTVGYALTGILVQLRAARELAAVEPGKASAVLADLEPMVGSALEDVRREVAALRERTPLRIGWQARLGLLCGSFSQCTGTRVNLDVPEEPLPLREEAGETVFRVVQESLTNAIRHGRASLIDVVVRWKPEERRLLLRVSDNGRGAARVRPGSGLSGISERVRSLGGEVAWETRPDKGFDLGVVLPVPGAAA